MITDDQQTLAIEDRQAPALRAMTGSEMVARYRELADEREAALASQRRYEKALVEAEKQRDAARRRQGDLWQQMDRLTFRMTPQEIAEAQTRS